MKMDNTEYAYKEMEKNIVLEQETIKQKQSMSKKYSQTLAAMWNRLPRSVLLPISSVKSARVASCAAAIKVLARSVPWIRMAESAVASSLASRDFPEFII